jgi:hypothetical protein
VTLLTRLGLDTRQSPVPQELDPPQSYVMKLKSTTLWPIAYPFRKICE